MAVQTLESPFYAPGRIEYLSSSGALVPEKNVIASQIRITWGNVQQIVTLNADGQPLEAYHPTGGPSP